MNSYDNAFEIVTDDPVEIANLIMKSNMMNCITDLLNNKGLTQEQSAKLLDVKQSCISALKNGKISEFSVGALMDILSKLGFIFEFNYSPTKQPYVFVSMAVTPPKRKN
jgi:predicted XRE-type DNA-binding protein